MYPVRRLEVLIAGYGARHLIRRREQFIQEYLGRRVAGDERCVDEVRERARHTAQCRAARIQGMKHAESGAKYSALLESIGDTKPGRKIIRIRSIGLSGRSGSPVPVTSPTPGT